MDHISLDEIKTNSAALAKAVEYFKAIADTIPHNADAQRHLAKIQRAVVMLNSLATLQEYGS